MFAGTPEPDCRTGFVDHIDRFVWQVSVIDIALREIYSSLERFLCDRDIVMLFISADDAPEDLLGLFLCGFFHLYRLESSLKSRVLLHIFVVFIESCGSDQLDLSSGKRGL